VSVLATDGLLACLFSAEGEDVAIVVSMEVKFAATPK